MSNENEILALEDARLAAQVANDTEALEAMLHDAMVYTHSSAVVDTKASFLEALRAGKTRYKRTATRDRKVQLLGDTALVTGGADLDVEVGGEARALKLRFLVAWTKTPAGWKFIAWQSTRLPA